MTQSYNKLFEAHRFQVRNGRPQSATCHDRSRRPEQTNASSHCHHQEALHGVAPRSTRLKAHLPMDLAAPDETEQERLHDE